MKIQSMRRLAREDFQEKDRELVDKLSFSITPILENIILALTKNLNFDNLAWEYSEFVCDTDATGNLLNAVQVRTMVKDRVKGIVCINAQNLTSSAAFVTGAPFIGFSEDLNATGRLLTVTGVTGLRPSSRYRLYVIIIT